MGVNGKRRITATAPSTSLTNLLVEIAARRLIEPLYQGDLDRLCGLYAGLNGVRLALHVHAVVSKHTSKALFRAGIDFLEQRGMLADAVSFGMSRNRWHSLVHHIADCAETAELSIDLEPPAWECPPTIEEIMEWIEASLRESRPVLVRLRGTLNHFSVIAGIDQAKIYLFDSGGLKFMKRSSFGPASATYRIAPKALLRIAVNRRG